MNSREIPSKPEEIISGTAGFLQEMTVGLVEKSPDWMGKALKFAGVGVTIWSVLINKKLVTLLSGIGLFLGGRYVDNRKQELLGQRPEYIEVS